MNNHSPLESLAAFGIAFAAGVASAMAMTAYLSRIKRQALNVMTHQ
jgi:hypothetical protein